MATSSKINQVKQEVTSNSPEKRPKNDEKHDHNLHRPEHLSMPTHEWQQKLAHFLGPSEKFFAIPELSLKHAVGVTPQPPTPVSTKDPSRHKGDDQHNNTNNKINGKGLSSTPPSTKLLHTSNAGEESASSSSNKTSSTVPSVAPMKKIKSATVTAKAATGTVAEKPSTGDDAKPLQRGVKSATSSPNFPTVTAEPRSGSQRQPTADKKLAVLAKNELNLKLFGIPALSSSESESESDDDSNEGDQQRLLATAPAAGINKKQPVGSTSIAPTRKPGRHALTASAQKPPQEDDKKGHNVPQPLLSIQQQYKDLHPPPSTNATPQKAATTGSGNRTVPGIDDISSIYKNITLPSPLSPQLLSPVVSSEMFLSSRASLSSLKQQFSPVLPPVLSAPTAEETAVEKSSPEHCIKCSPRSPSPCKHNPSPVPPPAAVSPPLPPLQPPPSWGLSNFVDSKAKQPSSVAKTAPKATTKPPVEPSRKTKLPSGSEATAKQPSPKQTAEPPKTETNPSPEQLASAQITSSKVPKVRRVVGDYSPSQKKTLPIPPQKTTPKSGEISNKRPASAVSCNVALDTSDLPGKPSVRGVQTSPDFVAKTGRESGFLVDGSSQTSWDLRAAFSTNCGVQAGSSVLVDANIQTESGDQANSALIQDAFGPSAPKQARRETACVQPLNVTTTPSTEQQASTSTGDSSGPNNGTVGSDSCQLLRSKFTIKPKTTPGGSNGGSSPFEPAANPAELHQRERERRMVNVIDWRGTYTEQTLQSEKTYYERGRLSKREADQEFPKQRNLDAFCIYLDAMLAFLLQVCAHESAHGGKAESKRRQQLLTFIDEALSKCAPTARDLTIDPRWDIPLVLCHQSKAVLATRLYDMQSRDIAVAASSVERAVASNNAQNAANSSGGNASSSPPGSVGSNSSGTSSSSLKKAGENNKCDQVSFSHLAKSIELVTSAFRLLEASKTSWARAEELSDKHKAFFDRFSPTLTLRASLLDLSSYMDRCITEFRALRNATGPATLAMSSTKASSKQQLLRPSHPPATSATTKH